MEKQLEYSFDDEVANKFCYDMDNKKIEVQFSGYYDTSNNRHIDKRCVWVIENWTDARSKLSSESSYSDLEQNLGIISIILSAKISKTTLELTINTLDNRYIDLLFDNPQLKLV